MAIIPRYTFRSRLLFLFLVSSLLPISFIAVMVTRQVKVTYKDINKSNFARFVKNQNQILVNFFEGYKTLLRSIVAQDTFISEVETHLQKAAVDTLSESHHLEGNLFATLASIEVENKFIDKSYIVNSDGEVIISTATNDISKKVDKNFIKESTTNFSLYFDQVYDNTSGKRVIPVATPIVRKSDRSIIGALVIEFNYSIINSLLEGSLYPKSGISQLLPSSTETYIVDEEGHFLTKLNHSIGQKALNYPTKYCEEDGTIYTGNWTSYWGEEVFGAVECIKYDGIAWTLVAEQPIKEANKVGNYLGFTIFSIAFVIGVLVIGIIVRVSKLITEPIKKLEWGADMFGHGNFDSRIDIHTGDELEGLAFSFNQMAARLKNLVEDLREEKKKLNMTATLLLGRDLEVRQFNDQLEREKEAVVAERNKLEVILSGIKDAVIAVDSKRNIVLFNKGAEEITGINGKEISGKSIEEVIRVYDNNEELPPAVYCPIRTDTYEGVVFSKENLKLKTLNKESFVHLISGKIKEGTFVNLGCILTLHDVTAEKQLEEMKLDFVAMAAHELRTPLTAIRGYSQILLDEISDKIDDTSREQLHRLVVSGENLGNLIDNLLNVSRIEKGTFKVEVTPLNLVDAIKKVANNFEEQVRIKNQQLEIEEPKEELPLVMGDIFRIGQVVSNLLANAITYTKPDGNIKISFKRKNSSETVPDGYVAVSVEDTGEGIPKEALSKLFTKFFRVSGALEQGSKGTGLGLFISKSIINMHKGEIWVESELGKGSRFTFTIPVATHLDIELAKGSSLGMALPGMRSAGIIINEERFRERQKVKKLLN